jgi:hypothetical protein
MAQIFNSFISGMDAGTQPREQRTRRAALEEAGRLYANNDAQGAENALIGAGLINEAGAYSALNEARRGRRTREAVSGAMTGLDPNASPIDRVNAGATAALNAGDTDQWAQFQQYANTLTQQERESQAQRAQFIGSVAASARGLPQEQRLAYVRSQVSQSPYANDPHFAQMIDDNADDLSDAQLDAAAQNSMSAAEILGMRRQEEQFQQQIAIQRQNAAYARHPDSAPLSDAQRRGLTNDYNRAISGTMDDLGILRPSLPYARLAVTHNGDTTNIEGVNSRSSDVALLRAAARAQTGPGVLTESEVFSTLSPSLQQALIRNVAYLDISQNGITPQDRLALAQFVMQSSRNVQRDVWDLYDQASNDWGGRGNAPTFQAPRIPHPEDEGRLQSAERGGAQVGREYVANGGRVYRFLAPGSWELSSLGGEADRSLPWQPRAIEQQQTQPTPQQRAANAPPVGTVVNGYRFSGGDPNNRNNWEELQPGGYRGR